MTSCAILGLPGNVVVFLLFSLISLPKGCPFHFQNGKITYINLSLLFYHTCRLLFEENRRIKYCNFLDRLIAFAWSFQWVRALLLRQFLCPNSSKWNLFYRICVIAISALLHFAFIFNTLHAFRRENSVENAADVKWLQKYDRKKKEERIKTRIVL